MPTRKRNHQIFERKKKTLCMQRLSMEKVRALTRRTPDSARQLDHCVCRSGVS